MIPRCALCGKRSFFLKRFRTPEKIIKLCTRCHCVETILEEVKQTGMMEPPEEVEAYPLSRGD